LVASLNIRSGPGAGNKVVGAINDKGSYTITDIQNSSWGRLKSGAGWINCSSTYCKRVGDAAAGSTAANGGSYQVKVSATDLNIRTGPGTNYSKNGVTGKGVFTITETRACTGSVSGWGKLKSGVGWISLDYATRV